MCLITSKKNIFVAKEEIVCYKNLKVRDGKYFTPYQDVEVSLNETLKDEDSPHKINPYGFKHSVDKGFIHAYTTRSNIDGCEVFKAIIPKGAEFFIGDGLEDICASEMFITDEIAKDFQPLKDVAQYFFENYFEEIFDTDAYYRLSNGEIVNVKDINNVSKEDIIGVVVDVNDNITKVIALEEKSLVWSYEYTQLLTESKESNDTNGKENTLEIVSNNSYNTNNYPAVAYCVKYKTKGTQEGDWFMPSIKEIQGVVNYKMLQTNIMLALVEGDLLVLDNFYWSSSEYGGNNAWILQPSSGGVGDDGVKNYQHQVRPFAAF